jgi:hypothetical protein
MGDEADKSLNLCTSQLIFDADVFVFLFREASLHGGVFSCLEGESHGAETLHMKKRTPCALHV